MIKIPVKNEKKCRQTCIATLYIYIHVNLSKIKLRHGFKWSLAGFKKRSYLRIIMTND